MSMDLVRLGMIVLLATSLAVELSIWMVDLGLGQPISMRVWWSGSIYLSVIRSAENSASTEEDTKNVIIWALVSTGPLRRLIGSFNERVMWAPAQLREQLTLR